MNERVHTPLPGVPMLLALLVLSLANFAGFPALGRIDAPGDQIALNCLGTRVIVLLWCGFFVVQPNNGVVLQLFGRYVGTARDSGLKWANPFYSKKPVSLRVRNFESSKLKVNDLEGSPIEI